MRAKAAELVSIGILIMVGCATGVEFERTSATRYEPTETVEVLRSAPADVEYEVVGFLTLRAATLSQDLLDRLADEARSLGADAIVVTTRDRGTPAANYTNDVSSVQTAGNRTLRVEVRAIKYP